MNESAQKACSICGKSYPLGEYRYGNRDNRSYCQSCNTEDQAIYVKGGREAVKKWRDEMRRRWKSR